MLPHLLLLLLLLSQDYKNDSASLFCMSALLLHRLLIGVFLGALQSTPEPDDVDTRYLQTSCLVVVTIALLGYVVCVRPYHVPCANFWEALVIASQVACLSRNFWFLADDKTVGGVQIKDQEAANAVYYISPSTI